MFCNCGIYVRVCDGESGAICPGCGRFVCARRSHASRREPTPVSWTVLTFYDFSDERGVVHTPRFDRTYKSELAARMFAAKYEMLDPRNSVVVTPDY